jgi:hypothetical protein
MRGVLPHGGSVTTSGDGELVDDRPREIVGSTLERFAARIGG